MKITPINPENYKASKSLVPMIRFSAKGPISLNKGAIALLNLSPGTEVNFAFGELEDGTSIKPLYIYLGTGFTVRGKADQSVTFNTSKLSNEILGADPTNPQAASYRISNQPEVVDGVSYYLIFTIKPLNVK
jgi:hypothetical protein